jgi:hypothetical protein
MADGPELMGELRQIRKLAGCPVGDCPAVYEVVAGCNIVASCPKVLAKCGSLSSGCPTVIEADGDQLAIVGKVTDDPELLAHVGEGEAVVLIDKALILEAAAKLTSK